MSSPQIITYEDLGLSEDATIADIRDANKKRLLELNHASIDEFEAVQAACTLLAIRSSTPVSTTTSTAPTTPGNSSGQQQFGSNRYHPYARSYGSYRKNKRSTSHQVSSGLYNPYPKSSVELKPMPYNRSTGRIPFGNTSSTNDLSDKNSKTGAVKPALTEASMSKALVKSGELETAYWSLPTGNEPWRSDPRFAHLNLDWPGPAPRADAPQDSLEYIKYYETCPSDYDQYVTEYMELLKEQHAHEMQMLHAMRRG